MIQGETIICISPSSWFSLWRNRQQIMSRLARRNMVIFVEPQRDSELSFFDNFRKKIKPNSLMSMRKINDKLIIISPPPAIPLGISLLGKTIINLLTPKIINFNSLVLVYFVRRKLKSLNIKNSILWLWNPFYSNLVGKFNEKIAIYYVYDEVSAYPQNLKIKNIMEALDINFCKNVDFIFTSSRSQYEKRKDCNQNIHFIPNGVDFDHFSKALNQTTGIPDNMEMIPRPIIGFIGLIGFQIDVSLLDYIARSNPDWSIVLVGPVRLESNELYLELKNRQNVLFLGERELNELPGYLKSFNIAIMPYNKNTHVVTSYPLKLHEYLAAGKPVVSVSLPELENFKDVVYIADSFEEFGLRIEQALQENSHERIQQRVAVARMNTWDQRIEKISHFITSRLEAIN